MKRPSILQTSLAAALCLISASPVFSQNATDKPSYVFFAAPSVNDSYYKPKFEQLLQFYEGFISVMAPNDHAIIIGDTATMPLLQKRFPKENLMSGNVRDVWIRDFGPIVTKKGVFKAKYRPNYMSAADARYIENGFLSFFRNLGVPYQTFNIVLDGGNFCYNGADKAVVTERIFEDNPNLSEQQIRNLFRDSLGVTSVAFVPEEDGDTTGHSDGMIKWLAPNRIGVNEYFDATFRAKVVEELQSAFPRVEIVDIPWNPTDRDWRDFADGTGVYANALTTPNAIYVPTYDLASDADAVQRMAEVADRKVIPVRVSQDVAIMGGAARCLSWQVSGVSASGIKVPGKDDGDAGDNGGPNPPTNPGGGAAWDSAKHRGTYSGKIVTRMEAIGYTRFTIRSNGTYSGRVTIGGRRGTARGRVSKSGKLTSSFRMSRLGNAKLEMELVPDPEGVLLLGNLQIKSKTFEVEAFKRSR